MLGLAGGMLAGFAAAGDIRSSFGKGRIAQAAEDPVAALVPASPDTGRDLAAALRLTDRDDCRSLEPGLRPACLDYVSARRQDLAEALDLPL